ncbi:TetR/AcrR family transcriptional regulator [Celerinatantimonas sp. MCCC 1A17872]|uniref:TetR/AcrR family transcriptional regulator n=1 Tax=Celerinatantimonas sp. MCCC 1A17872 TaxID=3177514 RepID=UPI0038CB171C
MTASPGRPRTFDTDVALSDAIKVFSAKGYNGTSIKDLSESLNLTAGSIYKAFKDKRTLFLKTLDYYKNQRDTLSQNRIAQADLGKDKIRKLLEGYAQDSLGESGQIGCMVVATAIELASEDSEIKQKINRLFHSGIKTIRELIMLGQQDGSIPVTIDPDKMAQTLHSITQGMRVIGKANVDKSHLENIVSTSMSLLD